ncbi:MAG: META domain-containing protein [Gammaproteobacteria bacterium]|jgi:heat shock protein HslJ|nr:META domain-containing protein [Gammaproteobacteria bacterium]MDX2460703.1 META domain-containing protein [Gammaproteobacteria bacterium]
MMSFRSCLLTLVLASPLLSLQAATLIASEGKKTDIGGITWKWQRTVYNNDTRSEPPDPSRYTILLMPEGHLSLHLDCNAGGGRYTLDGSSLVLELTHSTMAACPPDSLAQQFMKDLAAARIAFMRDGYLYLDLMYDTGTMKFAR